MTSRGPLTGWLNRNVVGIGLADLAADANYEMVFSVLPLFITAGLGAPALAVGLVEGIGDGSSAFVTPAAALGFGAVLSAIASAILWAWRGPLLPSSADRTLASRPSSTG